MSRVRVAAVLSVATVVLSSGAVRTGGVGAERGTVPSSMTSAWSAAAEPTPTVRTTVFVPIPPARLIDTRTSVGFTRPDSATVRIAVAGQRGVPRGAAAVVVTLTTVDAPADGYLTAFSGGARRPTMSNLSFDRGATISTTAVVGVGAEGAIDVYSSVGAVVIVVDIVGAFVPATSPARAGRYVATSTTRVLDTRRPTGTHLGAFASGEQRTVRVDPALVPIGASAVIANFTYVDAPAAGYFTVWAAGVRPATSNGSLDSAHQTRTMLVVVAAATVDGALSMSIFSSAGGDVLVDVVGYFTGRSAVVGDAGLFIPLTPWRALDTRRRGSPPVQPRSMARLALTGATAAWANITSVDSTVAGFVTARPAFTELPAAATLNVSLPGRPVANAAIVGLSTEGAQLYSSGGEHLLADISGLFTGTPIPVQCRLVFLAHGGSYTGGFSSDLTERAAQFALAGWRVVNTNYRVASEYEGVVWGNWYPRTSIEQPIPDAMKQAHEGAVTDLTPQLTAASTRGCVTHIVGYSAGGSAVADAAASVNGITSIHLVASAVLDVDNVGGAPMHIWHSANDPIITHQAAVESCPAWWADQSQCTLHDLGVQSGPHLLIEFDEAMTWLMLNG